MGPVSIHDSPDLQELFGVLAPNDLSQMVEELMTIDAEIENLATLRQAEGLRYEGSNRLGMWGSEIWVLEATLTGAWQTDRTVGCSDIDFQVERHDGRHSPPWSVWCYVDVNCDRPHCVDSPHQLARFESLAQTPSEAVSLLHRDVERIRAWLLSQRNAEWMIFRHSDREADQTG